MNREQFHSSLYIAGNCLCMASESLLEASKKTPSTDTKSQLLHVQESIDNCMVIIDALKHYLDEHPLPRENVLPFKHLP